MIERVIPPLQARLSSNKTGELEKYRKNIKKFTKIGKNSSLILLTLIEDILNLSKMEAGTFSITKSDFSMESLLKEIYDMFEAQCEQKNLSLLLDIDKNAKLVTAHSDKGRIKQVMLNLLSNALKFTFQGSITFGVKLLQSGNTVYAQFFVKDTGIGIRRDQQDKLFKLFGMISSTKVLNPNGTGIGLTVSKKYIEALEGTISLTSSPEQGTTVTFKIPIIFENPAQDPQGSLSTTFRYFQVENEISESQDSILYEKMGKLHSIR